MPVYTSQASQKVILRKWCLFFAIGVSIVLEKTLYLQKKVQSQFRFQQWVWSSPVLVCSIQNAGLKREVRVTQWGRVVTLNNWLTVDDPDDAPGEEEGEDEEGVLHLELRQALQQHQVHDERDHDNHGVKHLVTKLTTSKSTSLFFICQRRRRFIKNNNHKTNNVHKWQSHHGP